MAERAVVTDAELRAEIAREDTTRRHATALLEALGLDYGEDDEDGNETMCVDQDELDQAIRFIADAEARGRADYLPTLQSIAAALYGVEPSPSLVFDSEGLAKDVAKMRAQLHQHEGRYDTDGLLCDDAPTVASAELEEALATLDEFARSGAIGVLTGRERVRAAFSRIAAALGVKL